LTTERRLQFPNSRPTSEATGFQAAPTDVQTEQDVYQFSTIGFTFGQG
jgi:hypothetical protein